MVKPEILEKTRGIRLLLSDCDGVLTDGGVYYSARGEEMKRFSIRDGMGVERLRKLASVETGFVTGELSESVKKRAEKLQIEELHLGCKEKLQTVQAIALRRGIPMASIAYIGDDVNDMEVMAHVGLSACPQDAFEEVRKSVHIICCNRGGHGAFREFAELIIAGKRE